VGARLGFNEAFANFLRSRVYGGKGDPFRHGLATDGFRHRALMATAALLGWLSAVSTRPPAEPLKTLLSEVVPAGWGPLFVRTGVPMPPAFTGRNGTLLSVPAAPVVREKSATLTRRPAKTRRNPPQRPAGVCVAEHRTTAQTHRNPSVSLSKAP
jgi:hypothetical protein